MQGVHNKVNFDRKLSVVANTKTSLHGKIAKNNIAWQDCQKTRI